MLFDIDSDKYFSGEIAISPFYFTISKYATY